MLRYFYREFGRNPHLLIIFTANTIFCTSGYTRLVGPYCDGQKKWRCRGILQIYGKSNYELLAEITGDSIWIRKPQRLASLSRRAVHASVKFFKYLLENKCSKRRISFYSVLRLLNTREVQRKWKRCYVKNFENREDVYCELKRLLLKDC